MARYEITTPEPRWTGEVAGVAFAHGRAEATDPPARVIAYFIRKGYGVSRLDVEASAEPADLGDPDDQMPRKSASKADWVAYAVEHGVPAAEAESLTRDQLVERFAPEGADQ
jgi:hypothetical protein